MDIEKGLLLHWWHYYGKGIYTLAELEKFNAIIDEYGVEKVLESAVAAYICGDGSPTVMLASIRYDTVGQLFESLPALATMEEKEKELYYVARKEFVELISATYAG